MPGWVATGTQTTYTGVGGNSPAGLAEYTQSAQANISADGTVSNLQAISGPTSSAVYYGQDDYTEDESTGQWVPNPGAAYGAPRYTIDAAQQETYYAYDASGRTILQFTYKTWTTDAGATVSGWVGTTSAYDSAGRLTDTYQATYLDSAADAGQTDHILAVIAGGPAGLQVDTSVDPVYQAPLRTQHVDYNLIGQKADTVDPYGGTTTYTYDANGNVIRTANPDGTQTLTVYDALNRAVWSTSSFVGGSGTADPGLTTHTVYNQLGQVAETDQYAGTAVTIASHQVGTSVTPAAVLTSAGTLVSTTTTVYDPQGNAIETTGANGLRTGSVYTPDGKVQYTGPLTSTAPTEGHTVTVNGGVSTQAFTVADLAYYTETDPVQYDDALGLFYTRSVDADGNASKSYTDGQGRTVRTVYADGSFTQTLYSVGTTAITLDSDADTYPDGWTGITGGGYEVVNVAQRKGTETPVYTYDLYNAAGQLTDVWLPKVVDAGPNATTGQTMVNPHWHYGYDTAGNETAQVSGSGNAASSNPSALQTAYTTKWAYDQNGNKVAQLLPDGELQTWAYDVYGNNTSHKVFSATNHTTALQTTVDTYDTSAAHGGRLTEEDRTSSDATVPAERTTYLYDDSATLPVAERTGLGNVAEVDDYVEPAGTTTFHLTDSTHYTYDPISGQQTTITTAGLVGGGGTTVSAYGTIHYVYDEATGNLIETWTGADRSSVQNDVEYGYDAQGRLASVTQIRLNGAAPTTAAAGTQYDADGHVVTTAAGPTTDYTYDDAGNLKADAEPNGDTTTYVYNALNELTGESITNAAGKLLFGEHTDWYDNGQKKDVVDTRGDGNGNTTSETTDAWTYDNDNRLESETLTVQSGSGPDVPAPYSDVFQYDLDNNRTQETEAPVAGQPAAVTETVNYTYNGDDQLATESGTGANHYTTQSTYDADGNLKSQSKTNYGATSTTTTLSTYGYDLRNRMTTANVAAAATTYTYDYNGVLTSETTSGSTTYYLNDPNNLTGTSKAIQLSVAPGESPTTSYVLGLRVQMQSDATNGTRYLLVDDHGSTRALAGADGVVVAGQTFDYDAFGTELLSCRDSETAWLFGGDGIYDGETGWTYHLARWRNGAAFTTSDTFTGFESDPASIQRYGYAQENPVEKADPTGHFSVEEAEGGIEGWVGTLVRAATATFNGVVSGWVNVATGPQSVNWKILFAAGAAGGITQSYLSFSGFDAGVAAAAGTLVTDSINQYYAEGKHVTVKGIEHSLIAAGVSGAVAKTYSLLAAKSGGLVPSPGQSTGAAPIAQTKGINWTAELLNYIYYGLSVGTANNISNYIIKN